MHVNPASLSASASTVWASSSLGDNRSEGGGGQCGAPQWRSRPCWHPALTTDLFKQLERLAASASGDLQGHWQKGVERKEERGGGGGGEGNGGKAGRGDS